MSSDQRQTVWDGDSKTRVGAGKVSAFRSRIALRRFTPEAILVALLWLLSAATAGATPIASLSSSSGPATLELPAIASESADVVVEVELRLIQTPDETEIPDGFIPSFRDGFTLSLTDAQGFTFFDIIRIDAVAGPVYDAGFGIDPLFVSDSLPGFGGPEGEATIRARIGVGSPHLQSMGPGQIVLTIDLFNEIDGFASEGQLLALEVLPEPGVVSLIGLPFVLLGARTRMRSGRKPS